MGEQESSTLWLGNLDLRVTRRLLYEIGIQVGLVWSVQHRCLGTTGVPGTGVATSAAPPPAPLSAHFYIFQPWGVIQL